MRIAGYEFKQDCRLQSGANMESANEVGKHLERLREQHKGELTPADVLSDAKNNNSPLHSFFEWSDTKAAHEYRLQQARGLIRAVVAIFVDDKEPAKRIQAFVHVPESGAPHYRATDHAMSQEKTRDMILMQAWKEFQAWKKRYQHLEELSELFNSADKVAKRLPETV